MEEAREEAEEDAREEAEEDAREEEEEDARKEEEEEQDEAAAVAAENFRPFLSANVPAFDDPAASSSSSSSPADAALSASAAPWRYVVIDSMLDKSKEEFPAATLPMVSSKKSSRLVMAPRGTPGAEVEEAEEEEAAEEEEEEERGGGGGWTALSIFVADFFLSTLGLSFGLVSVKRTGEGGGKLMNSDLKK